MNLWSTFPAESAWCRQLTHTRSPDQLWWTANPDGSIISSGLFGYSNYMQTHITYTYCSSKTNLHLISYMYLSRYSVHCTRTIPSNGECSHTTPQQPSAPTTNWHSHAIFSRIFFFLLFLSATGFFICIHPHVTWSKTIQRKPPSLLVVNINYMSH